MNSSEGHVIELGSSLRARGRAAGVILGAWILFGLSLGQQVYMLQDGRGPAGIWSHALALELDYCMLWALMTPAILWLGRAFPLAAPSAQRQPRLFVKVAIHLICSLLVSTLIQFAHSLLLSRLFPSWFPRPSLGDIRRSLMSGVDYGFLLYWLVLLVGQSFDYRRSLQQAQSRQSELQNQLLEAQLQALKMQMHPHFLFNALNSVAELIHQDQDAAERLVTSLSELLRMYMRTSETHEVSLGHEIAFLRRYLEIQQVRFEERLAVQIHLHPGTESAVVPSLILQPLVENAIVHGLADRERDGLVRIDAAIEGRSLALRVADNGHGLGAGDAAPLVERQGLGNTRRRLERLFGDDYDFSLRPLDGGGLCVSLSIPLKRVADAAVEVRHA